MAINLNVNGNTAPLEAAVQAAVTRIRKTPIKITVDDKGATQPLGNMKRGADEFSKSMEAANARIIAFGASMAIINGVSDAFKAMVKNMVEVEKSLADINVVMGLSAQNLDKFGDGLFKVAKETGAAFKIAADAATEYARQGLSVEESLKRTKDALILTRLTGMDSAAAVKALTAAMNTYGDQIKDTTQLVSKFAAVDVKFAVSAEDFADAISRTGQAAKSAGVDINELVGLVTAAQQKTARGGKVIGNSFKTIFTRIGRTDTLNQLEDLGIAVRDLEGNTIGAKRILTDLANTFDTLTAAQQAQIAQTVGGVFQINVLKAVLSDAAKQNGILASATQISAGATDEAIQKNEQLRNTMSAMATETGLALKQVSSQIGEIMLAPGMEKVLNIVKSAAEGLGGLLGSGEGAGSTFAQGFLKGLGNIITGPGLVMMVAVFGKLLVKAAQYAHESLKSLIGVTSEAQKQKSIQTSLVNLFSQSSALSKEMLRTDISRTEKEKIILSLLKAQVLEANALNSISKQAASTLYKQGYGSNLAPRRGRAGGHIPNFANPERTQAAQGGYAAGSIRSMKMPGEGSVIYNSAETVKNFAGFKQPAIMPPHSSKAGKNYQQAFGDVHGFDPYAAGGYIPNYARVKDVPNTYMDVGAFKKFAEIRTGTSSSNTKATGAYNALRQYAETNKLQNLSPAALVKSYKESQALKSPKKSLAAMLVPPEGYSGKPFASYSDLTWPVYSLRPDAQTDPSLSKMVEGDFKSTGSKYASKISKVLERGPVSQDKIWKTMQSDTAGGAKGAWKAAVGALFEAAVNSALDYSASKRGKDEGDFDVRGGDLGLLSKAFDGFPDGMTLADYKSDDRSSGNKASFRKKVLKQAKFNKSQQQNKLKPKGYASGFIPNFANPLSDAIGREKEAGVPVSQIRVGSHPALMNKSNPIGLGVTNTQDEPNGLRDVFGANGFVPNYAQDYFQTSDIESSAGNRKERNRLMLKLNKELKQELKQLPKGRKGQKKLAQIVTSLGQKYKANESAVQKVTKANQTMGYRLTQSVKGMGSGMGGMGLMMGLPMLAGFIPGAEKPGSGANMVSGALTGAGTGAGIGMMFGPLGMAIGGVAGALGGLVSSLKQSTNAINEESDSRSKHIASIFPVEAMSKVFKGPQGLGEQSVLDIAPYLSRSMERGGFPLGNVPLSDLIKERAPNISSIEGLIDKDGQKFLKDVNEKRVSGGEYSSFREDYSKTTLRSEEKKMVDEYNKYVKNIIPLQKETIFKALKKLGDAPAMLPKIEKGEISQDSTKTSLTTYTKFLQEVAQEGILEGERGIKNLSAILDLLSTKYGESIVGQDNLNKATILRINSQKISLDSQNKFNKQIKRATSSQAEMNNQYASMMKVRADFMTKEEKFNAAYLNAIGNAEKERKKSNIKAEQGISGDVLKTLMSTDYQQSFKDYLKDTNDLSGEKFSKTNLEERRKILETVGKKAKLEERTTLTLAFQKAQLTKLKGDYKEIERLAKNKALSEQQTEQSLLSQKTGPQAFQYGFAGEQNKMRESAAELDHQLGGIVATNFRNGLVSGMRAAINQAENLGDVLQGVAMNFLQAIQNAYLTAAANQIVSAIPMPGRSRGGSIRNYSRGGGVPAMVTDGEYVMGRGAVNKYGGAFMHSLNAGGKIPGYSNGGAAPGSALASNFGGGRGYESGRAHQSRAMSGFFYSQSGNVGLGEDRESLLGVLAEEERARQAAAAKKAKKKAFWKQLLGTALSAGVSYGVGSFMKGPSAASKLGKLGPEGFLKGGSDSVMMKMPDSSFDFANAPSSFSDIGSYGSTPLSYSPMNLSYNYNGGRIRKYASGGHIAGKSGIDQIPAMLSEGEYVIRASSARQLGKPTLDRINAGKFNDGGSVSPINTSSESGISGGSTNNINISINLEAGKKGSSKTNSSGSNRDPVEKSDSEQSSTMLAEKIKQQVVSVIVEEQRPGGLLSD